MESECTFKILEKFPYKFKEFLIENKVNLTFFSDAVLEKDQWRYIRFKPWLTESEINNYLPIPNIKIEFLPNFYGILSENKLITMECYTKGLLYGIDLSSAAVVLALNPQKTDNILDLCCSPGSKLCFTADLMKEKENGVFEKEGSLTGVDINEKRLQICRSILDKYGHKDVKLFNADGIYFNQFPEGINLYDKVLVDAECTHDGSIKHFRKFFEEKKYEKQKENKNQFVISNKELKRRAKNKITNKEENPYMTKYDKKNEWNMKDFEERFLDTKKLIEITKLQAGLLRNAFKLVKPSGIVIYSTCSFIMKQNEEIISEFLKEVGDQASLLKVFDENLKESMGFTEGYIQNTVRFDPIRSKCGGMFIAKIKKNI